MVKFLLGVCVLALVWTAPVKAEDLALKAGHPERYVVKQGDTLWGYSLDVPDGRLAVAGALAHQR